LYFRAPLASAESLSVCPPPPAKPAPGPHETVVDVLLELLPPQATRTIAATVSADRGRTFFMEIPFVLTWRPEI